MDPNSDVPSSVFELNIFISVLDLFLRILLFIRHWLQNKYTADMLFNLKSLLEICSIIITHNMVLLL